MTWTVYCMELCKYIRGSRTKNHHALLRGQVSRRCEAYEKIPIVRIAIQELLKPSTLG